jgi:hypothetical protein
MMLVAVMALGMSIQTSAKKVQVPKMYIFGFAASFNDTIVHFTNVQEVDSAWIEKKNDFLQMRELYSYQMRDFLANKKQMPRRTCVIYANKNRKKVEKKYLKFKKLYTQSKNQRQQYDLRYLEDKEFHFKTINLRDYSDDVNAEQ